jgi:hypothetical protein
MVLLFKSKAWGDASSAAYTIEVALDRMEPTSSSLFTQMSSSNMVILKRGPSFWAPWKGATLFRVNSMALVFIERQNCKIQIHYYCNLPVPLWDVYDTDLVWLPYLLSSFTDHLIACCLILWQNVGLVRVSVCVSWCVSVCVCVLHPLSHPLLYLCVSLFCFGLKEAETITICTIGTGLPLQYSFWVQNTAAFFIHGRKKQENRSRIYGCPISLRFLGIILRVLRLEFMYTKFTLQISFKHFWSRGGGRGE